MKLSHCLLASTALISLSACSDKEEPEPVIEETPSALIISISGSNGVEETFAYDRQERVRQWNSTGGETTSRATYSYDSEGFIDITTVSTDALGKEHRFTDRLTLAGNGLVRLADGVERVYSSGTLESERHYSLSFSYNASKQMTAVGWSMWTTGNDVPRRWTNTLTWADGNMTTYTDCDGTSQPVYTTTYNYGSHEGQATKPLVYPALLPQYSPLQRIDYFGARSVKLPFSSEKKNHVNGQSSLTKYTYSFAVSATGSRIEEYTADSGTPNSKVTYSLIWDE